MHPKLKLTATSTVKMTGKFHFFHYYSELRLLNEPHCLSQLVLPNRAAHRTIYGIWPYRHGAVQFWNSWTRNHTVEFLRLDGYGAAISTVMTVKMVYRQ